MADPKPPTDPIGAALARRECVAVRSKLLDDTVLIAPDSLQYFEIDNPRGLVVYRPSELARLGAYKTPAGPKVPNGGLLAGIPLFHAVKELFAGRILDPSEWERPSSLDRTAADPDEDPPIGYAEAEALLVDEGVADGSIPPYRKPSPPDRGEVRPKIGAKRPPIPKASGQAGPPKVLPFE